eukprot:350621-Chlamydomonas_euryale.AAC.15
MLPRGLCGSSRVQPSFALFCAVWRHLAIPTHLWCELGSARSRVTPTGVSRGVTGETSYARRGWQPPCSAAYQVRRHSVRACSRRVLGFQPA